jgi:N-acyl amino acid synthase of PEP-CTERM/exosortase system
MFDRARTAEISRYAISKQYRRRQGESLYPDVEWHGPLADEMRRLVPHMSLGLIRGVYLMAAQHGIDTLCAAMAPPLLRLLERFGLVFERLGPLIDYHGMRQPCVAESRHLLAGLAARNPDYYQLVLHEGAAENAPACDSLGARYVARSEGEAQSGRRFCNLSAQTDEKYRCGPRLRPVFARSRTLRITSV